MRLSNKSGARRLGVWSLCLGVLASALSAPTAHALSPGLSFSAAHLPTWQTNGIVYAMASTAGKVVAGGEFTQLRPPAGQAGANVSVANLAILDAATGNPTACQIPVTFPSGQPSVRAAVAAPDNRTVYIGGDFTIVGSQNATRVARIDVVDCTVSTFNPKVSGPVHALALHGSRLYIGGDFFFVDGSPNPRSHFAAVNATTGAVLPWIADTDTDGIGRALAVSPDGTKVAIGGDFFTVNGQDSHSIAVVNATTGANVRTYPGFIPDESVTKHLTSDGTRFYGSNEGDGPGVFDGRFAVSWGSLNEEWRDYCLGATQASLVYQGTLYSASHAHDCTGRAFGEGRRNYFLAQRTDNGDHIGWSPTADGGIGEGIGPRAMTIGSGGGKDYLWYGGEFTAINGAPQQGLTRFGPDDATTPPVPAPVATATSEGAIQVQWRAVVDPDDSGLTYRVYRDGGATPVWEGSAQSTWWQRSQVSFVDTKVSRGATHSYRVSATDGVNTSAKSPAVSARATAPADTYASVVRSGSPSIYWDSSLAQDPQSWVADAGASTTDTRRTAALPAGGVSRIAASPLKDKGDSSGSLRFNGANGYLWSDQVVDPPAVSTVEAWFRTRSGRGGILVNFGEGRPRTDNGVPQPSNPESVHQALYMDNAGRVRFAVRNQGFAGIVSSRTLNDGQWHHVAAVQSGAGVVLYVDGLRDAKSKARATNDRQGVWHVGGDSVATLPSRPTSRYFAGDIDEVAIHHRALPAKTVTGHYLASGRRPSVTTKVRTDNYVVKKSPKRSQSSSRTLVVSSGAKAFLRFKVPKAPAGTRLHKAKLVLNTAKGARSASNQKVTVRLVASRWSPKRVTWRNQPALGKKTLGKTPRRTKPNKSYKVTLNKTLVKRSQGKKFDLALVSGSANDLVIWSRERGDSRAPQLILIYK